MVHVNQHDAFSLRDDCPCEHAREDAHEYAHDGGELVR